MTASNSRLWIFWLSLARSPTADESSSFLIHIFRTHLHVSRHMRMTNVSRLSWKTLIFVTGCHFIACRRPRCLGSYEAAFVSLVYIFLMKSGKYWLLKVISSAWVGLRSPWYRKDCAGVLESRCITMLSECTTHYVPVFIILNVCTGYRCVMRWRPGVKHVNGLPIVRQNRCMEYEGCTWRFPGGREIERMENAGYETKRREIRGGK